MSLLQMSVSGAIMIGVIVCIRAAALYRLPKNILLFLWGIALTRLLLPYSLPCAYSVYSLLGRCQRLQFSVRTANNYNALMISTVPSKQETEVFSISSHATMEVFRINIDYLRLMKIIWLIGVCICVVFFAIAYLKYHREFREVLPLDEDSEINLYIEDWLAKKKKQRLFLHRSITVRQFDRISTPLTYGVFHPVILLPTHHLDWNDKTALEYILTHEYTHIYYYDAILKLLLSIALCIHWFNPLVWVLYVLANRDIELRCDEAVIRSLGRKKKSDYAMTLILMAEQNNGFQPLCNRFSEWCLSGQNSSTHTMRVMEERITAIMKMKKLSLRTGIIGAVLSISLTTAFATSALPEPPEQEDTKQNNYTNSEVVFVSESSVKASDFKEYEPFGLKFDEKTRILSYQNKRVRYFYDGAKLEDNNSIIRLEYADAEKKGDIDIHTVRQREENGDGSYTVLGKLTGLEIDAREVFQNRHFVSADFAVTSAEKVSMTEKEFFDETAADQKYNVVVTMNAQSEDAMVTVNVPNDSVFYMENTDTINMESADDINVTAQGSTNVTSEGIPGETAVSMQNADNTNVTAQVSPSMTLEEKFKLYEKYGVRYEAGTSGNAGNVYYNDQLARSFIDISPTGNAFSFTTEAESDIRIQTVYDANGNLTGIKQTD